MTTIIPGPLLGKISIPTSKSQSLRALLFASFADSPIENLLSSPDVEAMKHGLEVLKSGASQIDAGNSGIVLRFLAAIAALREHPIAFTGDESLKKRPLDPLLNALKQLGAKIQGWTIQGPIKGGQVTVEGYDSQFVSALLIACSLADGDSVLTVTNPGEKPWVDLTLDWLEKRGAKIKREGYEKYFIKGNTRFVAQPYKVPTDLSSLAFPVAASLIVPSKIHLENMIWDPLQGDQKVFSLWKEMGAKFDFKTLTGPQKLKGIKANLNDCIDAVPIFATVACFAEGQTIIMGVEGARKKESNRLQAISSELNKMGADVKETDDGLVINPRPLKGAQLDAHHDHRIAMSLYVAALGAKGNSTLRGVEWIKKTYPTFIKDFSRLRRIFLTGAPNSGKTSVARLLAQKLNMPFLDTDIMLEEKFGQSVRDLHKNWGDARFRKEEQMMADSIVEAAVVSVGGGLMGPLDGYSIYLDVPLSFLIEREKGTRSYVDSENSFSEIIQNRIPRYKERADLTLSVHNQSPEEITNKILDSIYS